MIRRLCHSLCNCFGRITPDRQRAKMIADARRAATAHKMLAVEHDALSRRAALDARHHSELSDFYYTTIGRISVATTQEKSQ